MQKLFKSMIVTLKSANVAETEKVPQNISNINSLTYKNCLTLIRVKFFETFLPQLQYDNLFVEVLWYNTVKDSMKVVDSSTSVKDESGNCLGNAEARLTYILAVPSSQKGDADQGKVDLVESVPETCQKTPFPRIFIKVLFFFKKIRLCHFDEQF